jgi:V/A-type H+-transporting ATPase subunit F
MVKVAVLGDTESVKGFAAVGLSIVPCDDPAEAVPLFRRLAVSGEFGVIFVTEELTVLLERELKKLEDTMLPAVIPIPGVKGNNGIGVQRLRDSVERAVGSDIIFNS